MSKGCQPKGSGYEMANGTTHLISPYTTDIFLEALFSASHGIRFFGFAVESEKVSSMLLDGVG